MNTQKKREPLEISDGRFEKTYICKNITETQFFLCFFGNTGENGQNLLCILRVKTVGHVFDRDRLGRRWVPAMVLDVQSAFLK